MSDDRKRHWCRFSVVFRKPTGSVRQKLASADQQSSTNEKTNTSSMLYSTKKRKTLFNSRENSLMVSGTKDQVSGEEQSTPRVIQQPWSVRLETFLPRQWHGHSYRHHRACQSGKGAGEPRLHPLSFGPKRKRGLLHIGWLWNPTSPGDEYWELHGLYSLYTGEFC